MPLHLRGRLGLARTDTLGAACLTIFVPARLGPGGARPQRRSGPRSGGGTWSRRNGVGGQSGSERGTGASAMVSQKSECVSRHSRQSGAAATVGYACTESSVSEALVFIEDGAPAVEHPPATLRGAPP